MATGWKIVIVIGVVILIIVGAIMFLPGLLKGSGSTADPVSGVGNGTNNGTTKIIYDNSTQYVNRTIVYYYNTTYVYYNNTTYPMNYTIERNNDFYLNEACPWHWGYEQFGRTCNEHGCV